VRLRERKIGPYKYPTIDRTKKKKRKRPKKKTEQRPSKKNQSKTEHTKFTQREESALPLPSSLQKTTQKSIPTETSIFVLVSGKTEGKGESHQQPSSPSPETESIQTHTSIASFFTIARNGKQSNPTNIAAFFTISRNRCARFHLFLLFCVQIEFEQCEGNLITFALLMHA